MEISGIASVGQVWAGSGVTSIGRTGTSTSTAAIQPPPPPRDGSGVPPHLEAAADALGLSTDEVVEALQDGASLADLAQEQGVSRDDLVAALVAAAPQDMQGLGNLTELTESLVDQAGLGRPVGPPPEGSSGVFGAGMTAAQQDTLSSIADLLGTGTDAVLSALQNGSGLSDLFDRAGVTTGDLAGWVEQSLLLDTDA
ncbi:hypothetical protein OEB99_01000 [Actinotalea sp. M2MS4P-6]|uniref:hypothetical protein n=1 Tax=Actinotalea sp. M2MS4P-6 TaxID=2983762 RepID=UPI0021E38AC7|nr:hypothetical protein [Actinotalea sp. M2MS4P-6]MCV2392874.1 hypothetical protein [Actinotalea sp. M2MS4P-6]